MTVASSAEPTRPQVLATKPWPAPPEAMARLEAEFHVHHLWEAERPDALVASVAPRIRAFATLSVAPAGPALIAALPNLEIIANLGAWVTPRTPPIPRPATFR